MVTPVSVDEAVGVYCLRDVEVKVNQIRQREYLEIPIFESWVQMEILYHPFVVEHL